MKLMPLLCTLIILFFSVRAGAQQFSEEPEKFLKDIDKQLSRSNSSETKDLMKMFEPVFLEQLNKTQQNSIIEKANHFAGDLRFRSFPDLADYFYALVYLVQNQSLNESIENWHGYIEKMDGDRRKKKELVNFISGCRDLFDDNTVKAKRSGSLKWKSRSGNWSLFYDEQPYIKFSQPVDLVCYAKGDSIVLLNTTGVYSFEDEKWRGKGGKVTWERVGFKPEEVWADIKEYEIDMRRSEYTADSVVFHNSFYFSEPLLGSFEDKVFPQPDRERLSYPRFQSYSTRLPIRNIIDGVDYDGGFAQQAGKFLGRGTGEEPARIIIHKEGKPFLIADAGSFLIKLNSDEPEEEESRRRKKNEVRSASGKSRIVSSKARITMILEEDSITHPGLKFTLLTDDRVLRLERDSKGMSSTPYFNSFHEVEMEFEMMEWKLDDPRIEFTSLVSEKRARFTSNKFFKERMFDQLSSADGGRIPLVDIRKCTKKYDTQVLTLGEMCGCMKLPPTQVEPMMLRYTIMGYLDYNSDNGEIRVFDKVHHHVLGKSRLTDYDVIMIVSNLSSSNPKPNASMNLLNYDLTIHGVSGILLSDSHRVQIIPDDGKVILKKNRDMDFAGFVSAGKAEFYGQEFHFSYDDFKIDMPVVDSLQLWADSPRRDERGNRMEARVRTLIEDLRGDLKIDRPGNKSGIQPYPEYPVFTSERESYAYYDQGHVLGGAYDRDKFYFQLEPFELDSLDKFDNTDIKFDGTFSSAGIFEDMKETLVLQSDYSLGFNRKTERQGLEAYGGKGIYKNNLSLSNRGLRGDGAVEYLTARAESDDFAFYPDSVTGITQKFYIEEQKAPVEYPYVNADSTRLRWEPYKDNLMASSIENRSPISMYGGRSEHKGTLHYGPDALRGSGVNSFNGANLYSDNMYFRLIELEADTSDFALGADMFGDVDFSSENLHAKVNFQDNVGEFVSNTGRSLTKFGATLYQAYLDRFTWHMQSDEFEYSSEGGTVSQGAEEVEVEGAEFVSTHPKQDSLRFFAKAAVYNAREIVIEAREVDHINVADASVKPGDGKVVVKKDANMDALDSAKIIANTRTKYHTITDANVNITGRWKYSGSGTYWYEDKNGGKQDIYFNLVRSNEERQTVASGIISAEKEFTLSPQFNFKGDVSLEASEKDLLFEGTTLINHGCGNLAQEWFKFKSRIDPLDINIEIPENTETEGGSRIATGMMFPADTGSIYGTFMSAPYMPDDLEVLPSRGYLIFDDLTMEYRISSFEKLNERSLPGNYTALNTESCLLEGDGKMQLSYETGRVEVDPVGNYTFNTINKNMSLHYLLKLDFLFDDKLLEIIRKEIQEDERAKPVDIDNQFYTTGLRNYIGVDETDEMLGRMKLGKRVKLPDELVSAFFFNDIRMEYDPAEQIYVSKGELGIGSMKDENVNLYVNGGISLEHKRRGTDIMVYLNTGKNFYVFDYRASGGVMMIYTENEEFKERLRDIKGKDRRIKADKDTKQFVYQLGGRRLRSVAMQRFENID